jgi:vancomycin permeability regulator SanA
VKKIITYMCIVAAALGSAGILFTVFCNLSLKTGRKTFRLQKMEDIVSSEFAIVPGCLVYSNGKPSYALEDRLNAALSLYRNRKVKKIILSGAARENEAGRIYLTERKVPGNKILTDDGGLDTYSTVFRCKEAFPGKTFFVCTQKKYFKRTGFLIQELGMDGYCVEADVHTYKKEVYEKFRDFFAADKAWIECRITKPTPKYSLKELPISY